MRAALSFENGKPAERQGSFGRLRAGCKWRVLVDAGVICTGTGRRGSWKGM
jgi:hypothetical protein